MVGGMFLYGCDLDHHSTAPGGQAQGGRRKSINFVLEAFSTHFSLNRVEFFDSAAPRAVRQPAKSLRLAGGAVARGAQGS